MAALPPMIDAFSLDRFCDEIVPVQRRPWPYRHLCDDSEGAMPRSMFGP